MILHCYRLAKFYGCHPDKFLNEPVSVLMSHMMFTDQLLIELKQQDEEQ